jgi:hypothetical protein
MAHGGAQGENIKYLRDFVWRPTKQKAKAQKSNNLPTLVTLSYYSVFAWRPAE